MNYKFKFRLRYLSYSLNKFVKLSSKEETSYIINDFTYLQMHDISLSTSRHSAFPVLISQFSILLSAASSWHSEYSLMPLTLALTLAYIA